MPLFREKWGLLTKSIASLCIFGFWFCNQTAVTSQSVSLSMFGDVSKKKEEEEEKTCIVQMFSEWTETIGTNMKWCEHALHRGAVRPCPVGFFSTIARHKSAQTADSTVFSGIEVRTAHFIPNCGADSPPTLSEPTVLSWMVDFGPWLWTSQGTAGCGASQRPPAFRLSLMRRTY